jgi:uncharacterized protein (DUF488 family)
MKLFTIGFTKKNAEKFFTKLRKAGVTRVIDVRLNNQSQLAGFAKKDDLRYFLKEIGGMEYTHLPELAPTQEILDKYGKGKASWQEWEKDILKLLAERKVEKTLKPALFDRACLLCSEHEPEHCHRRVIAEYLAAKWGGLEIEHLT